MWDFVYTSKFLTSVGIYINGSFSYDMCIESIYPIFDQDE